LLHQEKLSPTVQPYYGDLVEPAGFFQVSIHKTWPALPQSKKAAASTPQMPQKPCTGPFGGIQADQENHGFTHVGGMENIPSISLENGSGSRLLWNTVLEMNSFFSLN
jgi:hypothetical protein